MRFVPMTVIVIVLFALTWGRPAPAEAQTGLAGVSQRYGTFLGGPSDDQVRAIAVDGQGYIYLTGWT